jgi:hypothetical protein
MKRIIKAPIMFMIAVGLLITLLKCSTRQFDNLDQEM